MTRSFPGTPARHLDETHLPSGIEADSHLESMRAGPETYPPMDRVPFFIDSPKANATPSHDLSDERKRPARSGTKEDAGFHLPVAYSSIGDHSESSPPGGSTPWCISIIPRVTRYRTIQAGSDMAITADNDVDHSYVCAASGTSRKTVLVTAAYCTVVYLGREQQNADDEKRTSRPHTMSGMRPPSMIVDGCVFL